MDIDVADTELVARLRRLDAGAGQAGVGFGYQALLDRHAARQAHARRRLAIARGTAGALVVALVIASVWRFDQPEAPPVALLPNAPAEVIETAQPRMVRADTYLAVAALEDHIASLDDALSDARLRSVPADVARLESTRALLVDSYAQVRYAEMVSARF